MLYKIIYRNFSANNVPDKFKKKGLTARKSEFVNAPIIEKFKVTMECKFIEYNDYGVLGEIVNVSIDEGVLDENGNIDASKINALSINVKIHQMKY